MYILLPLWAIMYQLSGNIIIRIITWANSLSGLVTLSLSPLTSFHFPLPLKRQIMLINP